MTKIVLVRHGHVDWIAPERFRGRAELPLSGLGERQAEALGRRVSQSWRPDVRYTSPLSRCVLGPSRPAHQSVRLVARRPRRRRASWIGAGLFAAAVAPALLSRLPRLLRALGGTRVSQPWPDSPPRSPHGAPIHG